MDEKNDKLLQSLEGSQRQAEAMSKLTKGGFLNLEETLTLSLVQQIRNTAENRAQVKAAMNLTEKTIELSKDSVDMAGKLVRWTKWLAVATFALSVTAFLNLIIN